jgi:hypothetical protein
MSIESKHRGSWAELTACTYLLSEGYEVFRNVSVCGPIDLLACKDGEILRIDVSSSSFKQLSPEQVQMGVVILRVYEDGRCEFEIDRLDRIRAILAEVADLTPKDAAEALNQRGITTPTGAQWMPGTVASMRGRYITRPFEVAGHG